MFVGLCPSHASIVLPTLHVLLFSASPFPCSPHLSRPRWPPPVLNGPLTSSAAPSHLQWPLPVFSPPFPSSADPSRLSAALSRLQWPLTVVSVGTLFGRRFRNGFDSVDRSTDKPDPTDQLEGAEDGRG